MKHIFTKNFGRYWLSVPFIWLFIIPVIILHICLEIYHQVCFRLYGIDRVIFSQYTNFDRQKLAYLSIFDKANCGYCAYVNAVFAYASEIGHRTEYYWCAIKHANQPGNPAFLYQEKFADYGDKQSFEAIRSARNTK